MSLQDTAEEEKQREQAKCRERVGETKDFVRKFLLNFRSLGDFVVVLVQLELARPLLELL